MPGKAKFETFDPNQPTSLEKTLIERLASATKATFELKNLPAGRALELHTTNWDGHASWLENHDVPHHYTGENDEVTIDIPQGNYPELAEALKIPLSQCDRSESLRARHNGNTARVSKALNV